MNVAEIKISRAINFGSVLQEIESEFSKLSKNNEIVKINDFRYKNHDGDLISVKKAAEWTHAVEIHANLIEIVIAFRS